MADVSIPQVAGYAPVALGIKPVQPTGLGAMSLSDVVGLARGTQQFQKEKELLPYQVEAGKAESRRAQLEAEKAGVDLNQHYANISRGILGGFVTDPDFINGNSQEMVKKMRLAHQYQMTNMPVPPRF